MSGLISAVSSSLYSPSFVRYARDFRLANSHVSSTAAPHLPPDSHAVVGEGHSLGNGRDGCVAGVAAGCAHPSSDLVQGTSFTARFPFLRRTEATTVPSMSAVEVSVSRRCTR